VVLVSHGIIRCANAMTKLGHERPHVAMNDDAKGDSNRMLERFLGAILTSSDARGDARPSIGEIGLNQFAPYLMNRVASRWNANLADSLKCHGMTTPKMRALAVLSITSGLTINELSVFAVIEQSTMSRTLDSMEEQGLIRRQQRSEDMRVREIHITEEGRTAFEKIWPMMYDMFVQMFDGVAEEEYRAFTATLQKVMRNIRKHDI
jgi:MarR family transcriptional regulator, transcriptional regulator for hemolysin